MDDPSARAAVEEYISAFPPDVQKALRELRILIRHVAPDATESMRFGAPDFWLDAMQLVQYSASGPHVMLHISLGAVEKFKEEIKLYVSSDRAMRFPANRPLPRDLIRTILAYEVHQRRPAFLAELKWRGWKEVSRENHYTRGDWEILYDTSSWMMVSARGNPRVFDVPVPRNGDDVWTVNLIEHLCQMEDERQRLRKALETIRDLNSAPSAQTIARRVLETCYHQWLAEPGDPPGHYQCPICGKTRHMDW